MNLLLMVVSLLLLVGVITGVVRGSFKVLASILTSALIIFIAVTLTPHVAPYVGKYIPLGEMVAKKVEAEMSDQAAESFKQERDNAVLTYEAIERVFDAAGIEDSDLEEFGISIADIVQGNVTMEELNEYGISNNLLAGLYKAAEGNMVKFDPDEWSEGLSKNKQYAAVEESDILPVFKSLINEHNTKAKYEELGAEHFLNYVGLYVGELYVYLTTFFLIFILAGIVIRAIIFALDIITGLPSKGIVNRLIGGFLGIVDMLIIIWILFAALNLFYSTGFGQKMFELIAEEPYVKLLYSMNPVWDYMMKMF